MAKSLTVGDEAPNFDLTSTEGVVLMLRDEAPRTPVLLFFCAEAAAADLEALKSLGDEMARARVKLLVISRSALADLTSLQREHRLPFPLLHDDRDFSQLYGIGEQGPPGLFLVGRDQRLSWIERSPEDLRAAVSRAVAVAKKAPPSTSGYPKSIINRVVDRWVN